MGHAIKVSTITVNILNAVLVEMPPILRAKQYSYSALQTSSVTERYVVMDPDAKEEIAFALKTVTKVITSRYVDPMDIL